MMEENLEAELELRCMSFNIKNAYDLVGENIWSSRKEMVAGLIRFHRPDLVGMQEVLFNQLEDLQKLLPEYGWIGVGREDGKKEGEFACIFYLRRRLEPLQQGSFWLSEQPDEPGSIGWDAACSRIVTWGQFKDTYTGHKFTHMNTHFDHVGAVAVERSSHMILLAIRDIVQDGAAILTGDFNVTNDSVPYRVLSQQDEPNGEALLRDASIVADYKHFGPAFTFQGFDSKELAARMFPAYVDARDVHEIEFDKAIDFIFVTSRIHVLSYGVIADHHQGKLPSDHFPIIADIVVKN